MLETEREFYEENRQEWLKVHFGKVVLVKGRELAGVFDNADAALAEGARRFGMTSFLVRPVQQVEQEVWVPALSLGILRAHSA